MYIKAIIFDVDGTLADTENIHRQAFNAAFREFDLDWEWSKEKYIHLLSISGGRERIRDCLESDPKMNGSIGCTRELAQRVHRRKTEIYKDMLNSDRITLRSGVVRLLNEAISEGIRLAIATSSSTSNVESLLENTLGRETTTLFDAIVTCDIVSNKKPSPAAYQFALAKLGLQPERCIAIEDTSNGNRAALATGIKTIITTHEFTFDSDFTGASLVVDRLGEPDKPFTLSSGNAFGKQFVDLEFLDAVLTYDEVSQNIECCEGNLAVAAK
jgi:HAD superfamily hydrolase (TIGR01509 family)